MIQNAQTNISKHRHCWVCISQDLTPYTRAHILQTNYGKKHKALTKNNGTFLGLNDFHSQRWINCIPRSPYLLGEMYFSKLLKNWNVERASATLSLWIMGRRWLIFSGRHLLDGKKEHFPKKSFADICWCYVYQIWVPIKLFSFLGFLSSETTHHFLGICK